MRVFRRLPRGSRLAFFAAIALNPVFERVLHRRGVGPARDLATRLGGHRAFGVSSAYDVHRARRLWTGVMLATRVGPADVVCLPRSLTLWTLLRRRGVPADLVIGVDPGKPGIGAHAWVNIAGVAVGEEPAHVASLHTFNDALLGGA